MASNPMQRKSRNSFLLGMLLMLVIAAVIVAMLVMQLMKERDEVQKERGIMSKVYVLKQDVKAGDEITSNMIEAKNIWSEMIPNNAIGQDSLFKEFSLRDKEGNEVKREYVEEEKTNNRNSNTTANETSTQNTNQETALFLYKGDQKTKIEQETTGEYYIMETNSATNQQEKKYIELTSMPLKAKVNMNKNTIITEELVAKSDDMEKDVRKQEYNVIVLPTDLETGDYVDIRIMFPSGQDYIVVSKKQVEVPDLNGVPSEDTIWVNLGEDEILHMSCAIIDAAQVPGTKIYATKYVDPGIQEAAIETYPIDETTRNLLLADPNLLDKAKKEIAARYTEAIQNLRQDIYREINENGDPDNIETEMEESITNSRETRKEYLQSLSAPATSTAQ